MDKIAQKLVEKGLVPDLATAKFVVNSYELAFHYNSQKKRCELHAEVCLFHASRIKASLN